MTKKKLFLVFFLALSLRLFHLNWDSNFHLHPDERMLIITVQKISWPSPGQPFFSAHSPLNPKFFAYGSFPIYFLKTVSWLLSPLLPQIQTYNSLTLLGRLISALADSLLIFLIYQIARRFNLNHFYSLLAALIYALMVLPIQLSHFYAVDTLLNLFIFFTLYRLILFSRRPNFPQASWVAFGLALSLATKVSATVLLISTASSLFLTTLFSLKKHVLLAQQNYLSSLIRLLLHSPRRLAKIKQIFLYAFSVALLTLVFYFVFQPYTFFDFNTFWQQINQQRAMTYNPFVFPYTLQYVNTLPYLYQLKNIFYWGLGPGLALLAAVGFVFYLKKLISGLFTPGNEENEIAQTIVLLFVFTYFLLVGRFAVKFVRYCLPLYPLLAIFIASAVSKLKKLSLPFFAAHLFWLFAFLAIYTQPNTRVQATDWILQNIPSGSTIAREHWDDGLPLGYHPYRYLDLPLYNPDTPQKWAHINQSLSQADYLIIASNRLYTPLSRLTDCSRLPANYCYRQTAQYYQDLFAGRLAFKKVAQFISRPHFLGLTINDSSADESFTVYDHPTVFIFQKTTP